MTKISQYFTSPVKFILIWISSTDQLFTVDLVLTSIKSRQTRKIHSYQILIHKLSVIHSQLCDYEIVRMYVSCFNTSLSPNLLTTVSHRRYSQSCNYGTIHVSHWSHSQNPLITIVYTLLMCTDVSKSAMMNSFPFNCKRHRLIPCACSHRYCAQSQYRWLQAQRG